MSARDDAPPCSRVRLADGLGTATIGLRSRPGRTVLTALGIAIGIAAMVATVGISASSRTSLLDRLDRLGTNLLEVEAGQSALGEDAALPEGSPAMVRRIAPVLDAASLAEVDARVYRNDHIPAGRTGGIGVRAADPGLAATVGATVRTGRFLDDATGRYPAVVLGSNAAEHLGIDGTDGAPQVYLGGQWFTVIGILDPVELVPSIDDTVLVGRPAAVELLGHDGAPSVIYVRTTPAQVEAVRAVLAATVNPEHPGEVTVNRPSDALAARSVADQTLTSLLVGLGAVALLVGGIGIANVMVIAVLERRGEIGVRRALGAARRHILSQFVAEGAGLSLLGGLLGITAGAAVTAAYARSNDVRVDLPVPAVLGGIGAALVVGALASLYPAVRAATLPPAEALRAR